MRESFDFDAYGRQVREVYRGLMRFARTRNGLRAPLHLVTVAMERDLARFEESLERTRIACGPGCGSCCVLNVGVLFPEAAAIAAYLRHRFCESTLEELRERLHQLLLKTRWLTDEERVFLREPCAFLDSRGRCLIHDVRPMMCRSVTSTDPVKCRDSVALAPLGGAPVVEMDLFHKRFVETVYLAMAEALDDLALDSRPKRLTAAVLGLLANPALIDCYLARKSIPLQ